MVEDKYIGLALAIVSTMAIGTSFVITKKGLLDASERHGFEGDGFAYLKSPTWWGGIVTMVVGEVANFAAYAYAPAILVTPLGALSVLIGAVLGAYFLKEELGTLGKLGCAMCLIGSVIIVLHAPPDKDIKTVDEILHYAIHPGFLFYCAAVAVFSSVMIYRVAPRHGKKNPLIYISICSTVGSISVMSVKAFGIALKLTLGGSNQFTYPSTYVFIIITVVCILTQMNYFNKALSQFSTSLVNPLYYVTFTTATLCASFILFRGFNTTDAVNTLSLLSGFLVIFTGVYLLNLSRGDPNGNKLQSGKGEDGIPTDGITGLQTRASMQTRRSIDARRVSSGSAGFGSRGDREGLIHSYDEENGGFGLTDLTEDSEEDHETLRPNGKERIHQHQRYAKYPVQGLLNIARVSYLICISGRQTVAQIRGFPVYVITSVALVPLSSQSDATKAIERSQKEVQAQNNDQSQNGVTESDTSADKAGNRSDDHVTDESPKQPQALSPHDSSRRRSQEASKSVAQDVIGRKGQYGRFAERWFSKKGWTSERRRVQGMSADDERKSETARTRATSNPVRTENVSQGVSGTNGAEDMPAEEASQHGGELLPQESDVTSNLLTRLLRTTKMLFASQSFFYSYDYDITRRLGDQRPPGAKFFWNQHLASPFNESGNNAYIIPLMQGFVGQRSFHANPTSSSDPSQVIPKAEADINDIIETQKSPESGSDFLLTLISRRSIMRPGLRYLRRGVDEEGHAANSVETEQILSRVSWKSSDKIYSFTQFRGSIPLFFSQSPYAFKPVPVLQHSYDTNHLAFKRHFSNIFNRYGDVQVALLTDKHGGEAEIGQQYEEHTKQLVAEGGINGFKPSFEWFDFHQVCRGMRFENVSVLMDHLGGSGGAFDKHGMTVEIDGKVQTRQTGVIRTNCMDCLDRTNVVQSACASKALEKQLKDEGVEVDLQTDTTTQWFNSLWADNGDNISKQYSSTAALKGDYTRTRKRNYRGALNDFGLTLTRYYNNIVNDYFSQAAIDYLLGNVTEQVFEEFESNMMSKDPAISMQKVRSNAIDVSSKIVVSEQSEDLIGGWTILSPQEPNTVRTFPFEEVVLLLTDAAVYAVRFDWNLEKVSSFERVDLRSITGIMKGTYITSTLTSTQTDEERNVGLVIKYRPGKEDVERVNTRSLSASVGNDDKDPPTSAITHLFDPSESLRFLSRSSDKAPLKLLAFKATPSKSSLTSPTAQSHSESTLNERDLINSICDDIRRAAFGADDGGGGSDTGFSGGFVEEREIIGLKEARKSTGYLEQWGHELKKLVWA
ncbi:MAG: hypothetical protein Q9218_001742 [Villophora microphyllina]